MALYKKIALHTFFQLAGRLFATVSNFIIILLIGQSLGSFGLGQYNKVFALVSVFALFVDFGISAIFLKIGRDQDVGKMILLRLCIAFVAFLLIQPIIFFLPYDAILHTGFSPDEKLYIELTAVSLFIYAFVHSLTALLQKRERFDQYILPNVMYGVCALAVAWYALVSKQIIFFFIAALAGLAASALVLFLSSAARIFAPRVSPAPKRAVFMRELFVKSAPLGVTLFLNSVYVRADVFLLSLFRSTSEVGIYALAYKFFEFPLSLSFFIMTALYPLFLKKHTKNKARFYRDVGNIAFALLIVGCLIVVVSFVGAPLIGLIKQDFYQSVTPFRVLIFSYPIFFLSNLLLWVIITENRQKILPFVYGASLAANVGLNLLFIPRFGYMASAAATVISEFGVLAYFYWFVKKNPSCRQAGLYDIKNLH